MSFRYPRKRSDQSVFERENMVIQQIRNATLKIKYGDIVFLIDPWFQDQGTGFSAKTVRPEMQGIKCPMNALPDTPGLGI